MCKKPPVPEDLDVPDLDKLIENAIANGTLTSSHTKRSPAKAQSTPVKAKSTPTAGLKRKGKEMKGAMDNESDEEKTETPSKMVKVEAQYEEEEDYELNLAL
jgi:hypothetical protein